MVHPDDIVIDGWDISGMNIAEAMERAMVLEPALQQQLKPHLSCWKPRPSIYNPSFIAANQANRADNTIGGSKSEQVKVIVADIEQFKRTSGVDQVVVVWTANTERFSDVSKGVHDTAANIKKAIALDHEEISPSILFAYAAIVTKVSLMMCVWYDV